MKKILLSSAVALSLNAAGFLMQDGDIKAFFSMKKDKVEFVSATRTLKDDVCISCDDFLDKVDFQASKAQGIKYDSVSVARNDGEFKIRYLVGANKEEMDLNDFFSNSLFVDKGVTVYEDLIDAKGELASIRRYYFEEGGAHPMHFSEYAILDENGGEISADYAFKDQEKLKALIEKKLRAHLKRIKHPEQDNKFFMPMAINSFYFDDLGIVFCYSPYDLFSYASGYIKVRVKFSEIKPFLKFDFLQLLKLNKVMK